MSKVRGVSKWILVGILSLVVAGILYLGISFSLAGGKWFIMTTPSMGTQIPVGTLVLAKPDPTPHIGQIVVFRPNLSSAIFIHKIVKTTPNGHFITKGNLDSNTDPGFITSKNIIGVVTNTFSYMGWLVAVSPIILIGFIMAVLLPKLAPSLNKIGVWFTAYVITTLLVILKLSPLLRVTEIAIVKSKGKILASFVNSGLIPLQFHAEGQTAHNILSGQVKTFMFHTYKGVKIIATPDLTPLVLLFMSFFIIIIPILFSVLLVRSQAKKTD